MKTKSITISAVATTLIGLSLYIYTNNEKPNLIKNNTHKVITKNELNSITASNLLEDEANPVTIRNSDLKKTLQSEYEQIDNVIKYRGIESDLANDHLDQTTRTRYLNLLQKRQEVFSKLAQLEIDETQQLLDGAK